jgi:short-subunit dehydrogenase
MPSLIIITGTSKGLGKAFAEESLRRGHTTIGFSRSPSTISGASPQYMHFQVDVADEKAMRIAMAKIKTATSGQGLERNILIANAGAYITAPIDKLEMEGVKKAIEENYYTYASSAISFVNTFPNGLVVGIAGYNSIYVTPKSAAYGSAKRAVLRFADSLRLELPRKKYQMLNVLAHTINTWSDEHLENAMNRQDVAKMILDVCTAYKTITVEEIILIARAVA